MERAATWLVLAGLLVPGRSNGAGPETASFLSFLPSFSVFVFPEFKSNPSRSVGLSLSLSLSLSPAFRLACDSC